MLRPMVRAATCNSLYSPVSHGLCVVTQLTPAIIVYTIISVEFEFGPAKEVGNIAKHGLSLALTESLEWELLLALEDSRECYGELRMVGFAPVGTRVYCVVFTELDDVYRIISLRKALPNEVRAYASQI